MRFYPQALIDAETGLPIATLRGQSGIVVPVGSSTPLNLRDIDGNVIDNTPENPIVATALGFTPLFDTVEDVMEAEFLSMGLRTPLVSVRGLYDEAAAIKALAESGALDGQPGPQGLPGINAVPAAEAVTAYLNDTTSGPRILIENLIGGYAPEAIALFARMAVRPDSDRRAAIDRLVRALLASGVWAKLEGLHVLAAHTSQAALLNWLAPTADLSAVNSPTFVNDRGFKGDGTNQYLTGPTRSYVKYLPENLSQAVWTLASTSANDNMFDISGPYARINPKNTSSQLAYRANQGATTGLAHMGLPGMFLVTRPNSAQTKAYRNGALLGGATATSSTTTPSTAAMLGLRYASGYSDRQIALMAYGAALSDAEASVFYNAVADYMTAVGVAP